MKNQTSGTLNVPASGVHVTGNLRSRISAWLKSDNALLSSVMEEQVTNRQALLISQCFASFSFMAIAASHSLPLCIIGLFWFALSLLSTRKGGEQC